MGQLFCNNVEMQLASNLGANDTSFTVVAGQGSQCPTITADDADFMLITFTDKNGNKEVVKVIEHLSGSDVFTIGDDESVPHVASVNGRAYEATFDGYQTALAIVATDVHKIRMPITAATFQAALGFTAVTATANELNELVTKLHALTYGATSINNFPLGYLQRPKFAYSVGNVITIGPGVYHHSGTTEQIVYWNSTLTKTLTVSGTRWYYLYLSDSSIVTNGPELTADQIFEWPTAPAWSDAKHGWYNGNDRCIFAYYVASGSIVDFNHDGGDLVLMRSYIGDTNAISVWGVVFTPPVPGFVGRMKAHISINTHPGGSQLIYIRKESSSVTYDSINVREEIVTNVRDEIVTMDLILNSSQQVILASQTYSTSGSVITVGWYFPTGI